MNILSVKDVSRIGREEPLFTNITFGLNSGDKAALIGRNGTGKSTLLSVIAGVLQPDNGEVTINKSAGVSYLAQNPQFLPEDTIKDHIFKSSSPKLNIIRSYEDLCIQIEKETEQNGEVKQTLKKQLEETQEKMDKQNLWEYESQIQNILGVLGLHNMKYKMKELSGGMIKKVALAQVLVEDTNLLLLDEPTNHLDITTIKWLEDYLRNTNRTVLMVTHDRYFLDAVCNNIYELFRNKLKLYTGNYSTYLEKKQTEAEIEANTERRIESVLRFERDWLLRGPCARGTKAKARIQHDMALINREKFSEDKGFTFEVQGRRLGGKILELHGISKKFSKSFDSSTPVIKNFSYTFNKGEKIGIFGNNGSGKSTLLNIITESILPDTGTIVKGENTFIAYYQQNPVFKDLSITVLEYVKEASEVMKLNDSTTLSASLFLEQFGFTGKIQHSMLSTLSGGERKRLFLVRLLLSNPNFLILDEPTNDFDIFTMNILEKFLLGFKGCLLVVSHDRYFMDKICDTLFIMENDGSISGYVGKCSEYIQYREMLEKENKLKEGEASPSASIRSESSSFTPTLSAGDSPATPPQKKKLSYKEKCEFEQLEKRIAELEEKLPELESLMASSDYATSQKAGSEYAKFQKELNSSYERWEELAERA